MEALDLTKCYYRMNNQAQKLTPILSRKCYIHHSKSTKAFASILAN